MTAPDLHHEMPGVLIAVRAPHRSIEEALVALTCKPHQVSTVELHYGEDPLIS